MGDRLEAWPTSGFVKAATAMVAAAPTESFTNLFLVCQNLLEGYGAHPSGLAFAHRESQKLAEQEKRNRQAQTNFKEAFGAARGFLEEFAPDGGLPEPVDDASDGGDSGSGDDDQGSDAPARRRRRSAKMDFETEQEQLTKKLLPQLVRFATEDQRALQDAAELLTFFVQRHFPDNKELADLAQKPSPEKLLKGLLGVLEKELTPRSGGGKDEKASDQEDEREERDRGDRGEASPEKERRYREERDGRHRDDRERDGRDRGRDGGRDMRDGRDGRGRDDRRGDDRGRFEERRGERDRGGRPGDPRGGDRRGGGGGRGERRGDDRGGRDRPGDHGGHRDHRRDHGDPRGKGDGRARGRSRSRDARR
ncbi:unnamed protein product [Symbiodinium sp. CCMP2592]|nr:unnamed protein product [Symbiodinium sp. CCMP2592]